jgi:catechol 2,3-dioxygenase-like lactoylglutathione lyase family enzyme
MAIFTHLTLGTADLARAGAFYDAVLAPLGIKRLASFDTGMSFGVSSPEFYVLKPSNGQPASAGNGFTIGFQATTRAAVDAFHREALSRGATCEGPPGPRAFAPNAYCAYIRDQDGHKSMAGCFSAE